MFINSDSIPNNTALDADLCIVGAGAVGITMARHLADSKLKIVIIESGDLQQKETAQDLHKIDCEGLDIDHYSRIRAYGGTTTEWTGRWKHHEKNDFIKKDWIKHSGWPISMEELIPYYKVAGKMHGVPALEWFEKKVNSPILHKNSSVEHTVFRWVPRRKWNFAKTFYSFFRESKSVEVLFNAHVTDIATSENGKNVSEVRVKTDEGRSHKVRANFFVLAAGGIENARLLLTGNNLKGIGNDRDQVGRFFMEHPKGIVGDAYIRKPLNSKLTKKYRDILGEVRIGLKLTDLYQEENKLANSYILLGAQRKNEGANAADFPIRTKIKSFMEQCPDPENRVNLTDKKDRFGIPTASTNLKISDCDKAGIIELHRALKKELEASGLGTVASPLLEGDSNCWKSFRDASHHMGGTRMGSSPSSSVVDENCKVHDLSNLFVSGSSTFPTGGYANPTATLLALAVRLAEHLKFLNFAL